MSDKSKIEWTVRRGTRWRLHEDQSRLKHCYAETFAERFRGVKGHPYERGFDLRLVPSKLEEPLRWKTPKMIFVNSMSDLFHERVPDEYIEQVASRS